MLYDISEYKAEYIYFSYLKIRNKEKMNNS